MNFILLIMSKSNASRHCCYLWDIGNFRWMGLNHDKRTQGNPLPRPARITIAGWSPFLSVVQRESRSPIPGSSAPRSPAVLLAGSVLHGARHLGRRGLVALISLLLAGLASEARAQVECTTANAAGS